jgi:hypothetical protein
MLIESRIDREQANVDVTMTTYPDFPVQLLIWSDGKDQPLHYLVIEIYGRKNMCLRH